MRTVIEPGMASLRPAKRIANHKQGKSPRVASDRPPDTSDSLWDFVLSGGGGGRVFGGYWSATETKFSKTLVTGFNALW